MVSPDTSRSPALFAALSLFIASTLFISALSPVQAAKPKEVTSDLTTNPGLAERQLERKKQEWRDVKTEQKRVIDEFLKCVEAAKYLSDVTACERTEKEESAKIKRAVKGLETIKR